MIEKYPAYDSTMDGWSLEPMESKVYRVNYVEGLEQQNAALVGALEKIAKGTCVMGNGNEACPIEVEDYYWCYPHIAQQALALAEANKTG